MKHIATAKSTLDGLPKRKKKWIIIYFYFDFRSGDEDANSQREMLRSFASQLMPKLPRECDELTNMINNRAFDQVSSDELRQAICASIRMTELPVFALIDGLDEYLGDLEDLALSLLILNKNSGMKMCLASRPERSLIKFLQRCPTVRIQDHNSGGIRAYIIAAINARSFEFKTAFPEPLIEKLVEHANGVFLWARFASDDLVRAWSQGCTEEQLAERLNDMPAHVEAMYQRILDRLEQTEKDDAALILRLICDDNGDSELRLLFDYYTFITADSDPSARRPSFSAFLLRLHSIFSGHLDIDKKRNSARLTHKTLQSFMKDSGWMSSNLSKPLRQNYPKSLRLRVIACAIETGSAELYPDVAKNPISSARKQDDKDQIRPVLDAFVKSRGWWPWVPLLRDSSGRADDLFFYARQHESYHGFSYSIIHGAMGSDIMCIHRMTHHNRNEFSELRSPSEPILAANNYLHAYLEDWVADKSKMNLQEQDNALYTLNFAFQRLHFSFTGSGPKLSHWLGPHEERQRRILQVAAANYGGIRASHLCFAMNHAVPTNISGSTLKVVDDLRKMVQARPVTPWPRQHHPDCPQSDGQHNLLYDWTRLAWHPYMSNWTYLEAFLHFLIDSGEAINEPCYHGGNVLHAILDPMLSESKCRGRLDKFLLAVKAGADVEAVGKHGATLQSAESLAKKLSKTSKKWRAFFGIRNEQLTEVTEILAILSDHEIRGGWDIYEKHYIERPSVLPLGNSPLLYQPKTVNAELLQSSKKI